MPGARLPHLDLPFQPQDVCQPITGGVEATALLPVVEHHFRRRDAGIRWWQHLIL